MSSVSPTRLIGGRYVVLGELGRGGMGIVWRAEDRVMGRHVAVKELHLPDGLSPEERRQFRERLLREARTAGRLNDPGIVTVYDVVTDAGVDHIVMELIEARTLADLVATQGPLDERAVVSVARALLAALQAAHDRGVVHRDVKPSNVMLVSVDRVKLTDFGIAQAVDDPRLTATGSMVGSPGYMAPERLEGASATPAADLWALGATLFFAITGTGPFARDTTAATISAVLHAELPDLNTRGPLGTVIAGLLQRPTQSRLNGEQAAALLASQNTSVLPVRDGEATTRPAVPAPMSRSRRWVWPAAALVVGLVVGLVAGLVLPRLDQNEVPTLRYGEGGDLPVFEITADACLPGPLTAGRSFPSGSTVSCENPHDLEIFETLDPFGSQRVLPYPDAQRLTQYAASACTLVFSSDLIVGSDKDRLRVVALVPSEASFERERSGAFPDRDVICVLRAADGQQLTGTRISKAPT